MKVSTFGFAEVPFGRTGKLVREPIEILERLGTEFVQELMTDSFRHLESLRAVLQPESTSATEPTK